MKCITKLNIGKLNVPQPVNGLSYHRFLSEEPDERLWKSIFMWLGN